MRFFGIFSRFFHLIFLFFCTTTNVILTDFLKLFFWTTLGQNSPKMRFRDFLEILSLVSSDFLHKDGEQYTIKCDIDRFSKNKNLGSFSWDTIFIFRINKEKSSSFVVIATLFQSLTCFLYVYIYFTKSLRT